MEAEKTQLEDNKNDFKERVQVAINELECPTVHMMETLDFIKAEIIKKEFENFKTKVKIHLLTL